MSYPVAGSPACFFAPGVVGPVTFEGRELWLSYRLPIATSDRVHFLFEQYRQRPLQGLQVSVENRRHELAINAQPGRRFILWTDTAPRHVEVEVIKAGRGGTLVLMNAWQDETYGTTMYGLNWCAMDVRADSDGSLLLDCSDGYGSEPSFGDLVVRVIHERGGSSLPTSRPSA
jgi:hypothetical protein